MNAFRAADIQRAIAKMREDAAAADGGRWWVHEEAEDVWAGSEANVRAVDLGKVPDGLHDDYLNGSGSIGHGDVRRENLEHVAGMDPPVALALAAWLQTILDRDPNLQSVEAEPAWTLVRTYLREEPS